MAEIEANQLPRSEVCVVFEQLIIFDLARFDRKRRRVCWLCVLSGSATGEPCGITGGILVKGYTRTGWAGGANAIVGYGAKELLDCQNRIAGGMVQSEAIPS